MKDQTVLIAGCGDLGQRVAAALIPSGVRLLGLRRSPHALPVGIEGLRGDYLDPASLWVLRGLAPDYLVLILKPTSYEAGGYWQGFVTAAQHVLSVLDTRRLRLALVVSSTRVYAETEGAWVDEDSPVNSAHYAPAALLAMEATVAGWAPMTAVRFGGIYGDPDGMLIARALRGEFSPLEPLRYGNRIHREDAGLVLAHLLQRQAEGAAMASVYNAVDNDPAPQAQVERFLAAQLGVALPAAALPCRSGERDVGHKRVSNQRLRDSGFVFRYPDYRAGYAAVLAQRGQVDAH